MTSPQYAVQKGAAASFSSMTCLHITIYIRIVTPLSSEWCYVWQKSRILLPKCLHVQKLIHVHKNQNKASQILLLVVWGSLSSNLTSDALISNKSVKKTTQSKNEARARNQDIKMMILLYRQRKEKTKQDKPKQISMK